MEKEQNTPPFSIFKNYHVFVKMGGDWIWTSLIISLVCATLCSMCAVPNITRRFTSQSMLQVVQKWIYQAGRRTVQILSSRNRLNPYSHLWSESTTFQRLKFQPFLWILTKKSLPATPKRYRAEIFRIKIHESILELVAYFLLKF